ncbi:hypothetical protein LAZ67_2002150 [Cordylochernes scorpioides]|uniref:Uncharacterized protein n=1 Tax=Cordylochernes scorpioides TaxID=51811 RepID=A0ABY6K6J0_9ARAC|nr:hypothetical protein LAZ67_2002150 [Cordylochernes scorpioides]
MFSSSSFYEEPNAIFPTVEEQVELCRKIADSLSSASNQRSKGANMFFKRVKRSQRWVHEDYIRPSEECYITNTKLYTTYNVQLSVSPLTVLVWTATSGCSRYSEASTTEDSEPEDLPYVKVSKGPPKLKLILDPRQIQDLTTLRQQGVSFVEHTTQSPDVCRDIVRDLNSPQGRGAKMFAKRKLKSEEWVVDESRVREYLRKAKSSTPQPAATAKPVMGGSHTLPRTQKIKMVKSPWEAALESPFGSCDSAFVAMHPIEVAETVIRAAESKFTSSCFSGTTTEGKFL